MFSMEQALAICTANIKSRATATKRLMYVMYVSNDTKRYDQKIQGFTCKQLREEFYALGGKYKYAIITKVNDDKPVQCFNRDLGKKFKSPFTKRSKKA